MRKASMIAAAVGMTLLVWGCGDSNVRFAQAAPAQPVTVPAAAAPAPAGGPSMAWVVPEAQLKHLGLETAWSGRLEIQPTPAIIDAYVLGDFMMFESADRRLTAVDRKTGVPKWTVEIPNRCDFRGCEDDAAVYVPCRNVLVAVDKRGFITWRKFLNFGPGGVPVADGDHVYLPCFDGRIRAFLKDSRYFDLQWTTRGPIESRPAVGPKLIYAGSSDGVLYALRNEKLDQSWSFKTFGAIKADLIYDKMCVYVASTDGNLYCLNALAQGSREQQLAWHLPYSSGAPIDATPFLGRDTVFVVNRNRECHAVERETGRKLWVLADVDKVLTQGKQNTYLLRHESKLIAVDNKTGVARWELDLPAGAFAFTPVNSLDDILYLIKNTGETQAVREIRPPAPVAPAAPVVAPAPAPAPAPKAADKPAEDAAK